MSFLGSRLASDMDDTYWSYPSSQRTRYGSRQSSMGGSMSQTIAAKKRLSVRKMRSAKGSRTLQRAVKRVVGTVAETKCLQTSGSITVRNLGVSTSDAQFNAATLCVTPQGASLGSFSQPFTILANGIGQDQRIGDRVTIKGTYIDFLITAQAYNATTNPTPQAQVVCVWLVRPKSGSKLGLSSTFILGNNANANLFENQANADSGLSGLLVDTLRKVDTDNYQVLARREYKIGYQGTLNSTNVVSNFQSNDFKQYIKDRIKLRSEDWRVNRQEVYEGQPVYMFVTSINADGTAANASYIPVKFDFNISVYYTDL